MALERKDVVTDDALMAPQVLSKELEGLLSSLDKVRNSVKAMNDQLSGASGISDVSKGVEQLTASEKEVIKVQNQLSTSLAKSNDEYIEYKRLVNEVNKAVNDKVKFGNLDAQQVNKANSSLNTLTLALQKNRQAYAQLTSDQARASTEGKKLLKTIQEQDTAVKDLSADMGVHTANVGNYAGRFDELRKIIIDIPGTFKNVATSIWGMVKAAVAFIATPLGLILAAISVAVLALIKYFKGSEDGAQKLRVIMAVLSEVFSAFVDVLIQAGRWLANLSLDKVKQGFEDMGNAIKDFVIERINLLLGGIRGMGEAFTLLFKGEFKEAAKTAGKAFLDIHRGINPVVIAGELLVDTFVAAKDAVMEFADAAMEDAKKAADLQRRENDLIVARRKFLVEEAKLTKEINELKEKTGTEKDDATRLKLLEQTSAKVLLLEEKRLALKTEERDIQKERMALGEVDEENLQHLAELEKQLLEVQAQGAAENKKLIKQITDLRIKIAEDERKRQEQVIDDEFKARKDGAMKAISAKQQEMQDLINIEKQIAIKGGQTREEANAAILNIQKRFGDDVIKENIRQLEQVLMDRLTAAQKELEIVGQTEEEKRRIKEDAAKDEAALRAELAKLEQDLIDQQFGAITENKDSQLDEIETFLEDASELYSNFADSVGSLFSSLSENRIAGIEAEQEALNKQYETDLALAGDNAERKAELQNAFNAKNIELEKKKAAEQRKAAVFDKATSAVQASIATALAVTKSLPNVPLAIATGIFGAIQVAAILSKSIPAYAVGTDSSKEGFALVGERGSEIKITPRGDVSLTPGTATLDYLEKGTKIIPHDKSMQLLAMNSLNTEYRNVEEQKEWTDISKKLDALNHTIRNKRETHINFSRKGAEAMMKNAESRIWFLNEFYK